MIGYWRNVVIALAAAFIAPAFAQTPAQAPATSPAPASISSAAFAPIDTMVNDAVTQGQNFGVGSRVIPGDGCIPGASYDFARGDGDGAHRDFARRASHTRQAQRFAHVLFVWIH